MSVERIKQLRQSYAGLHDQVLEAYRRSDLPNIREMQDREFLIVRELQQLGGDPYELLRAARAL
jgi:hypothetical protein